MTNHENKANKEDTGGEGIPTASYGSAAVGPGEQVGPYKLLRILGEGGYGIVYLAERHRPVKRRVALKVIKPGMDTKQVIARFEAERQALALLDHPNIAHVFNAGTTDAGRPYFVMEYVKGVPITEHCDLYKLTIEERLKMFLEVCEAVQHAHQKAIIHRDIKPSNILVRYEAEQVVPMIIDFGVAKTLTQPLTDRTLVTEQAQMIGTPEYMSPEQAEMSGQDIDTRTDIYSLGVLLYELLTGTLPFDSKTLREGGPDQMRRMIRDQDPQTPSARLSTIKNKESLDLAVHRRTDIRTLGHRLHGELDWITLKAMDKDRTCRYQTAHTLAEDIQRYLNQEPVLAGPPSATYKLRKLIARNRSVAAAVLAVAITLLVGIAGTTTGLILANSERKKAVISAASERQAKDEAQLARGKAENEAESRRRLLYVSNMNLAMQAWEVGNLDRMKQLLDQHSQPEPGQEDLRGFEWNYLWNVWHGTTTIPSLTHEAAVNSVAFSPDGKTLASASGNTVHLWDPDMQEQRYVMVGHTEPVNCVSFSPDSKILASGSNDNTVILWDPTTGNKVHRLKGHDNPIRFLVFTRDGTTLFSGSNDETIVWNVVTGNEIDSFKEGGSPGGSVEASSPDGKILAVKRYMYVDLRDVISGNITETLEGHTAWIRCAAFSPNSKILATGSNDSSVRLWDLASKRQLSILRGHAAITSVAFSSDSKTLAASCEDRTVRLWDTVTDQVITLKGHASPITCVAFSPEGDILASGSNDKTVRLWNTTKMQDHEVLKGHTDFVWAVAISPDGKILASAGSADQTIRLWTTNPPMPIHTIKLNPPTLIESHSLRSTAAWCVSFSPDGKTLAIGTGTGAGVKLWDIESRREVATLPGSIGAENWALAFSPDGKILASRTKDGISVWDVVERRKLHNIEGRKADLNGLAFSPDNKTLAIAIEGHVVLWDVDSQKEIDTLEKSGWRNGVAFSPDGKTLALGAADGTVRIWNVALLDGGHIVLKGHMANVYTVAFSPDGNTLASGSEDGTIKLWNLKVNQEVATLRGHTGAVGCLVFSPDGKTLISSSADATIRLWHAATEEDVLAAETKH
ncbi:protein kinase [Planctomycetota bacterium]